MSNKIGVGLIGSGIFVEEEHLPAVQACENLELKAIYSRSLKSAKKVAKDLSSDITLYSDDSPDGKEGSYDALLARSDVSAVIIALPIMVQPDFIKKALRAGKHVLAEKPIAPTVVGGKELVDFYHSEIDTKKINFSIAEQLRYLAENDVGVERIQKFGKILGCRMDVQAFVGQEGKYFNTEWRKTPQYQGGFLLDGGVHSMARLRMLLGSEAKVVRVSAQTAQLQKHLPPVDTLDAVVSLANGSTGTLSISFGTSLRKHEFVIACEDGVVKVERDAVTTSVPNGKEEKEDAKGDYGGVMLEVFAWAKSLKEGKWDPRQSAEEALADVELLEACLKSGEKGGEPVDLKYQI